MRGKQLKKNKLNLTMYGTPHQKRMDLQNIITFIVIDLVTMNPKGTQNDN